MQDRAPNLLESWKEIALFLGRDKRTAMRWAANHGMPVHRYPGAKQARVFALRDELQAWLESFAHEEASLESANQVDVIDEHHADHSEEFEADRHNPVYLSPGVYVQEPSATPITPLQNQLPTSNGSSRVSIDDGSTLGSSGLREALWRRGHLIGIVMGLFLVSLGAIAVLQPRTKPAAAMKAAGLIQLTDDGRFKGTLRTDGRTLFFDVRAGVNGTIASVPVEGGPVRSIPTPFGSVSLLDVSRDGKTLLVVAREGIESIGKLWTLPAQGGTPTAVGQIRCADARWSPDGRQIAFTAGNSVYMTDAQGNDPREIVKLDGESNLIWAPDGRRLRFVVTNLTTRSSTGWEIESSKAGSFVGSIPRQLPLSAGCCADWSWTEGGKEFLYVAPRESGEYHSHLNAQRLFRANLSGIQEELSLSLGRVVSISSGEGSPRLYIVISNADRGELLRYSKRDKAFENYLPGLSARFLSFSRDGEWLVYTSTKDSSLWRSKSDGTQALKLVAPPMESQLSSWSPDGRQIAFMGRYPGKPWRIYLIGRDGGIAREAVSGDDNQGAPTWSPDGKTIVYGRVDCAGENSCGIFLVDLETGRTQPLPASEKLRTARWSPDGKYIAALEHDLQTVLVFNIKERRWLKLAENVAGDDLSWSRDSQFLYLSCLINERPSIDKVRISDRSRTTAVDMSLFQKMSGQLQMWFGLAPDDSPIVLHLYTSSEVYALDSSQP